MRTFGFLLLLLLLGGTPLAQAQSEEDAWINDELYVPMRSDPERQARIIESGLKTGTAVKIVEWSEDDDWARVRHDGEEGWIQKHYLSRSPIARMRLERLEERFEEKQEELETAQSEREKLRSERDELTEENETLESDLEEARDRLEHLEEVAEEPERLDKANRELNEKVSTLRTELDQAEAQNAMLRDDKRSREWAMGAGILLLGGILGWIFKARGNRGRGNWMN